MQTDYLGPCFNQNIDLISNSLFTLPYSMSSAHGPVGCPFEAGKYLRPKALLCVHLGGTLSQGVGIAWLGLDTHFACLHGSQGNVSKELCTSRGCQVEGCPPQVSIFLNCKEQEKFVSLNWKDITSNSLTSQTRNRKGRGGWGSLNCYKFCSTHLTKDVTIEDLKHLIETKLAETLHGVANEGRCPALGKTPNTILLHRDRKAIEDAFVLGRIHLGWGLTIVNWFIKNFIYLL